MIARFSSLFIAWFSTGAVAHPQCAMCRESVASRDNSQEVIGLSKGLNFSILLMLGFLFSMVAVLGVMIYLNTRQRPAVGSAAAAASTDRR